MSLKRIALCLCLYLVLCDAQQCRYVSVPVCTNNVRFCPGYRSPPRIVRDPVVVVPRSHFGSTEKQALAVILAKVTELERLMTYIISPTCATSLSNGRRKLSNGEEAYCENGWTVFQRRFDGSEDFFRPWVDYRNGFGDLSGEFWLGLQRIHNLTAGRKCRLRIELYDFDDNHKYAEFSSFAVSHGGDRYRLRVSGYSGTAGDSLKYQNGMRFTTRDYDNDKSTSNCAREHRGAGWFNKCFTAHLNAPWGKSKLKNKNIIWFTWKGMSEALKATTMKLRCD